MIDIEEGGLNMDPLSEPTDIDTVKALDGNEAAD